MSILAIWGGCTQHASSACCDRGRFATVRNRFRAGGRYSRIHHPASFRTYAGFLRLISLVGAVVGIASPHPDRLRLEKRASK